SGGRPEVTSNSPDKDKTMKTELTIRIEASNLEELQQALATLQMSFDRTGTTATDLAIHTDAPGTATVAVAKKAKAKKAEPQPEPEAAQGTTPTAAEPEPQP